MADNVIFKTGNIEQKEPAKVKGQVLFSVNNAGKGEIYFDKDENTRIRMSGNIAEKLVNSSGANYSLGSTSRPVYFSNGVPVECGGMTNAQQAIPYIVGPATDTTAGTWTGVYDSITALVDGLTIIYVPAVAGASTTTLNLNGLGAKTCYLTNTTKLTTQFSAGTPIMLTYKGGTWKRADYNSDNKVRQYLTSDSTTAYPILFRYNTTTPTNSGKYTETYSRFANTITATSTGTLTAVNFVGDLTGNVTGKATIAEKADRWTEGVAFKISAVATDNTNGTTVYGNEGTINGVTLSLPTALSGFTSIEATTFNGTAKTAETASKAGHATTADALTSTLGVAGGGTGNTSFVANRIIYSESNTKLSAANHYISNTQISLGDTFAPSSGMEVRINGDVEKTAGHIYLTGAKPASSTSNTTQIVFGTASDNHVAISSNNNALVINQSTTETASQIVLYLDKSSLFPKGITGPVTGNLTGTADKAKALNHNVTVTFSENSDVSGSFVLSSLSQTAYTTGDITVKDNSHNHTFDNITDGVAILEDYAKKDGSNVSGTWNGLNIGGNAASASKLATARTIFGRSFDGSGNIEGEATVYGTYTATASARYASGGLEVREAGMVGDAQSDIGYAPSIGFHWGGKVAASLLFHNDGIFYFKQQNGTSRSTIDANLVSSTVTATGNITSSADIISNYLCTKTAAEESSTSTSIAVIASNGYLRKLSMPSGANYDSGSNIWSKLVSAGLQGLSTGSSQPTDSDYFISQYAGGGTSHPEFYRRPVSALWGYMNGKAASVYAKLASPNNMIHNDKEVCWVPDNYNNYICINYRSVGGTGKSTVTGYKFGNANGTTDNVFVEANTFSLLQQANITYNSTDKCIEFTFA